MDEEHTLRPKRNTTIKRVQTFAAADGLRYTPNPDRRKAYTIPLFPPLSASVEVLSHPADHDRPADHSEPTEDTIKRTALSRDHIHHLPLSPRSAVSSGFGSSGLTWIGSSGLTWSEASFRHSTLSPDSAISLFSSSPSKHGSSLFSTLPSKHGSSLFSTLPSKHGSLVAKRRLQFENDQSLPCVLEATRCLSIDFPERPLVAQTTYVTSVFEVLDKGLAEIADWVGLEMRHFLDQQLIIACCEVRWSTPDKHRDIASETLVKSKILDALRANNSRVWDRSEGPWKSNTEELMARKWGITGGTYRRYYGGLVGLGHEETPREHAPWWTMSTAPVDDNIPWPTIAPQQKISVLMLNMICLRFDQC